MGGMNIVESLSYIVALIIICHGIDAWVVPSSSPLPTKENNKNKRRDNEMNNLHLRYQLQTSSCLHHRHKSKVLDGDDPRKFPRKRRRRRGGEEGGRGSNLSNIATRSRATLTSFEKICQREKRNNASGKKLIETLNSMLDDLFDDDDTKEDGKLSSSSKNLSHHIIPRDASSLIRLLGRNNAYMAMLKLCRRYCRDIHN